MTKKKREEIYKKFNGRCAYCGRVIEYKDMQVDHLVPQRAYIGAPEEIVNSDENLMPSCRRCNHYKRAHELETFRGMLKKMREKVLGTYLGKVAVDYGMVAWLGWDGKFYYEYASELVKEECNDVSRSV